jgi:hypothetical protein
VKGGKPIAVLLQSISGVSAINPLVAFYNIHGGKREVLFFNLVHHTRHYFIIYIHLCAIAKVKQVKAAGRYIIGHQLCSLAYIDFATFLIT